MSARGRSTCRDVMLFVRRSLRMLGVALCIPSVVPSSGQTLENPGLAYVVSPPPATRGTMPNYLPKLPPESTGRVPQVSAHGARFRTGCRSCRLRPRHVRRRHHAESSAASRRHRHAGHRAHHRRGGFARHRWHLPRQHRGVANASNRQGGDRRYAPRRRRGTRSSMDQGCVARSNCNTGAALRSQSCRSGDRNRAAMNQQFAVIDLRKSQLSLTSAAVLCHFISASSRMRGAADWRLGGT
jgi:hypothetical protein